MKNHPSHKCKEATISMGRDEEPCLQGKILSRKSLLVSGAGAIAALGLAGRRALADAPSQAEQAALATGIPPDDGLAHPIPYTPPLGVGKERGLSMSGGAIYLVSFYSGYLTSLAQNGVDLKLADVMVGTSAGTLGTYAVLMNTATRMKAQMEVIGLYPATMNYSLSAPFSSMRAGYVGNHLPTASVQNIQALGRAAMAAQTNPVERWQALINQLTGAGKGWPSPKFHTTAIDCYTGQRLIVAQKDNVHAIVAMSASSSWPGLAGPTSLKDRRAMDGGTCQTSTHADVLGGAKRVLIVSLASGDDERDAAQGLRLSHFPNSLHREVKDLEAGGSQVLLIVVGCPPGYSKVNLVDPALIPVAIKFGTERGVSDAAKIKALWS
jgi:NTE family protein